MRPQAPTSSRRAVVGRMPMRGEPPRAPRHRARPRRCRDAHSQRSSVSVSRRARRTSAAAERGRRRRVVDPAGEFVAKGIYDPIGAIAMRVCRAIPTASSTPRRCFGAWKRPSGSASSSCPPTADLYRVVHSEGDALPGVTVDRYGDHLVVHFVLASAIEPLRDALYDALEDVDSRARSTSSAASVRRPAKGSAEPASLARGESRPSSSRSRSGHEVRRRRDRAARHRAVPRSARGAAGRREHARGGSACSNLFSYTGAFSVYGGERRARSRVGDGAEAHARARRNLQANGSTRASTSSSPATRSRCWRRWPSGSSSSNLIMLDPPSFGQSKERGVFSVQKDYRELVEGCLAVARRARCSPRCRTRQDFGEEIDRAIGDAAARSRRQVRRRRRIAAGLSGAGRLSEGI